jgi:phage terminase small subunit
MPGPAPKPTALKLVQGNPGKRKLNKSEPKFCGAPVCPAWITDVARAEWKRDSHCFLMKRFREL